MSEDLENTYELIGNAHLVLVESRQNPRIFTINGENGDSIEFFYDLKAKKWDCTIIGDATTSVKVFIDLILKYIPVCTCVQK